MVPLGETERKVGTSSKLWNGDGWEVSIWPLYRPVRVEDVRSGSGASLLDFLDRGDVHVAGGRARGRLVHVGGAEDADFEGGFADLVERRLVAVRRGRRAVAAAGAVDHVRPQRREVDRFAVRAELVDRSFGEEDDVALRVDAHQLRPVDGQSHLFEEAVRARARRGRRRESQKRERGQRREDSHGSHALPPRLLLVALLTLAGALALLPHEALPALDGRPAFGPRGRRGGTAARRRWARGPRPAAAGWRR